MLYANISFCAYTEAFKILIARTCHHVAHPTAPHELRNSVAAIRTTQPIDPTLLHHTVDALDATQLFPEVSANTRTLHDSIDKFLLTPGYIVSLQKLLARLTTPQAKGHLFEIWNALRMQYHFPEETVEGFNVSKAAGSIVREFDIQTSEKLIECKNIDWDKGSAQELRNQFKEQSLIALFYGIAYEVHSRQKPTKAWLDWFSQNNIHCFQIN